MAAARTPDFSSCWVRRSAPRRVRQNTIVGPADRDELGGDARTLRTVDPPEQVVRTPAVGLGGAGVVANRVTLVVAGENFDGAVEGRREQHRLAAVGRLVEQAAHLGKESHVGHAVGFVDHHDLDLLEVERVLAQQVGQATGAGNQDVDAAVQRPALRVVADAAVDGAHAEATRRRERLELAADLRGELARGREDQRGGLTLTRAVDACDERHAERDRLSGTGGCTAADVATGERVGNRRGLDVERLRDPGLRQYGDEVGGHADVRERADIVKNGN